MTVWIIDDDDSLRFVLNTALSHAGYQTACFEGAHAAIQQLKSGQNPPQLIISDVRMPQMSGLEFLEVLARDYADIAVIIITAHADLDSAVLAYEGGAFEYLPKPFDIDVALDLVKRALDNKKAHGKPAPAVPGTSIIGESQAMQSVFRAIGRLARTDISVLITGESGTGKELVAHSLYQHSPRREQAFIALNMAAIPKDLLESELFGHERGAFTGANSRRIGRFEQADGGTLFLDEIGDMPAALQTRLLRVLADGCFYRVGGSQSIHADVRIIAATNQNLEQRVKSGEFREDLYHRLNVINIALPPLRERGGDITLLLKHFLQQGARELATEHKTPSSALMDYLFKWHWPGNVRELYNLCRYFLVMAPANIIELSDLPEKMRQPHQEASADEQTWQLRLVSTLKKQLNAGDAYALINASAEFEKIIIAAAMRDSGGHIQNAARLLGWGRNTLGRKLKDPPKN